MLAVGLLAFFARDSYGGIKAKPAEIAVDLTKKMQDVESRLGGRVDQLSGDVKIASDRYHEVDKQVEGIKRDQEHIKEGVDDIKDILERMQQQYPSYPPPQPYPPIHAPHAPNTPCPPGSMHPSQ
jgi:hypothetical protein